MTKLLKPSVQVDVSVAGETVMAGQPIEVAVRLAAGRPVKLTGGEVELVRDAAVTHSRRQCCGGGGPTGVVAAVPRRAASARGVRVEPALAERVPARADEPTEEDRDSVTLITAAVLTEHLLVEFVHRIGPRRARAVASAPSAG